MIVITRLYTGVKYCAPGDIFNLTISDATGCEVVISEQITIKKTINFVASFRFALEDGTCPGFHLTGIFGNKDELPIEIKKAILFEDLTAQQQKRFMNSVGCNLISAGI